MQTRRTPTSATPIMVIDFNNNLAFFAYEHARHWVGRSVAGAPVQLQARKVSHYYKPSTVINTSCGDGGAKEGMSKTSVMVSLRENAFP